MVNDFGNYFDRLMERYQTVVKSKYYHYGQYLGPFIFTFFLSWICLDISVNAWLPKIGWIISNCNVTSGESLEATSTLHGVSTDENVDVSSKVSTITNTLETETPHISMDYANNFYQTSVYCYGVNTIYRANLALAVFYLTSIFFLVFFRWGFLHYYLIRWIYFLMLGALSMILPTVLVKGYVLLAFVGSIVFLILNAVSLVDLTRQVRQYVLFNNDKRWLLRCYWFAGVFTLVSSIMLDLLGVIIFPCGLAQVLIIVNLLTKVSMYLQYFWPLISRRQDPVGCFLSCGIVGLYNSFVLLFALQSGLSLDGQCGHTAIPQSSFYNLGLIANSLVMVTVILWTSYSIANLHNFLHLTGSDYSENIFAVRGAISEGENIRVLSSEKLEAPSCKDSDCSRVLTSLFMEEMMFWRRLQQMRVFFCVMILATFSLLTSMTSWQFYNGHPDVLVDSGWASMWAKIGTVVITYILFMVSSFLENNGHAHICPQIKLFDQVDQYAEV